MNPSVVICDQTSSSVPDMTEERIAHILNEASQLMKGPNPVIGNIPEDSHSNDSKSPNIQVINLKLYSNRKC